MTTPEQFAIHARGWLVSKNPVFGAMPQGEMLLLLAQVYTLYSRAPRDTFPPSLEEVTAYLKELKSDLDPQDFMDFYQQKDWMVGKVRMKDWRSAARRAHRLWDRPGRRNTPPKGAFFA